MAIWHIIFRYRLEIEDNLKYIEAFGNLLANYNIFVKIKISQTAKLLPKNTSDQKHDENGSPHQNVSEFEN